MDEGSFRKKSAVSPFLLKGQFNQSERPPLFDKEGQRRIFQQRGKSLTRRND